MWPFLTMVVAASLASSTGEQPALPISAEGPSGELEGTLVPPGDGEPLILIIPGSGPTDRDGNNPMGVTAASYRLLAEALGERRIGSVRIDKRGMFGSAGAIPDANDVTIAAYADDVHAWIASAKAATGVECVWVLGHSEGGLVALEAAQRPEGICGVILVASMGRKTGTILREQLQANPANAPILDQALEAIDTLEAGGTVDVTGMHPALMSLFAPQVQGFLKDMMARDPAELASSIEVPMLVVSGAKDIHTPPADGKALAEAQPEAVYVEIADMNHVLKTVTGEGRAANLATYADPSKPVSPQLVEAISDFVTNKE